MDIKTLLQSLLDHNVRFVLIGAWALPAYGGERMTRDIDIFISPTSANVKRIKGALRAIGYGVVDDVADDVFLKKKVLLRDYLLQTDIHPFVKGVDFSRVWRSRKGTTIKGLKVFVPALDDLITMKKAAGRPKDKEDLKLLLRVKRKLESKNGR